MDITHRVLDPLLWDVEFRIAGRTQKHQLPGGDRQIGVVPRWTPVQITPTPTVCGAFWPKLLLASIGESFPDCGANAIVPFGIGHAVDFRQHHARNGVVVVSRDLVRAVRHEPACGRILRVEDIINRTIDLRAVGPLLGLMAAGQHGHDTQTRHSRLSIEGRQKRSVRLLTLREESQAAIDRPVEPLPLFG